MQNWHDLLLSTAGEIDEATMNKVNPYVIGVSFFAVVFAGVAGSAYALYKEVSSIQAL